MQVKYVFGDNHEFLIENYDRAKTFSSFLPGIAGVDGIPMWSFYVNRGQVMGSFGVKDKDGVIMEFFPANVMYRNIGYQGFRTFIRKDGKVHEIFSPASDDSCVRSLSIGRNLIRIYENNAALGLKITVTYFTMPRENFAALVRKVEIERSGQGASTVVGEITRGADVQGKVEVSGKTEVSSVTEISNEEGGSASAGIPGAEGISGKSEIPGAEGMYGDIEILDGLPQILPAGIGNAGYQSISNLARAWFDVCNNENDIAFYKVRASIADTTEVDESKSGNFYLSFTNTSGGLIPPIFDMDVIFSGNTSLTKPIGWDCSAEELRNRRQVPENKVSGGFTCSRIVFPRAGQETAGDGIIRSSHGEHPRHAGANPAAIPDIGSRFVLCTIIGHVSDIELLNARKNDFTTEYIERKEKEAERLVGQLTADTFTKTANPLFDQYIEQSYLDNFLRGGYPCIFGDTDRSGPVSGKASGGKSTVYHLYSRKHGDIEREYNFFSLEPSYYSQGNGNFRDVNQNRRNDVLIKPQVGDFDVRHLMSLIQADGYNPLLVKGCTFTLEKGAREGILELVRTQKDKVGKVLASSFTPGGLISCIEETAAELSVSREEFLCKVLAASDQEFEAEFGEGYWSDHWTYNMDLIEAYLEIYPDHRESLLFDNNTCRFFYSPVYVLPRSDKYVYVNGKVRQYGAVWHIDKGNRPGGEKAGGASSTEAAAGNVTHWLRSENGNGAVYETNLFVKLISLAVNKFTSLDPFGMGIEMEAGRPGWNDAMNGLPGLFGSGLSETIELKRIVDFLKDACTIYDRKVALYSEAAGLMVKTSELLDRNLAGELTDFRYWDSVSALKEEYREQIRDGIGGKETSFGTGELLHIFEKFGKKLERGLDRALALGNGIYPTYFSYDALEYKVLEGRKNSVNGYPTVEVERFGLKPLPLFLEAPARMLKTVRDSSSARTLYGLVKSSKLYDNKLKMYKTSVPLDGVSFEAGRLMAFTPGWLEREAVFMHMEYKYLYAVLKSGLYDEFFTDIKTMLVPFMKPEVYGRSTLENSSFIASSANPDEEVHGRGFVARMTGTTAELLSIWFLMMAGESVFRCEGGELSLTLNPILPGWLFDGEGKVSFRFLGKTLVTYVNPLKRNTYGENGVKPVKYAIRSDDGETVFISGSSVPAPYAESVRNCKVTDIEVTLC